jgi:hypothetical protein
VEDVVTEACLCVCHEIAWLFKRNTYPDVDWWLFRSPAQSASHDPASSIYSEFKPLLRPPSSNINSVVPLIYHRILFTAVQWVLS